MANRVIKEKSALVTDMEIIRKKTDEEDGKIRKKRVAAYCRVSTDMEKQLSSLKLQMSSYERLIKEHPDWELAGIYADKGKTGTNVRKRPEFQRLIRDAMAGKIDVILAKSVSRFARNTVDTLDYTRKLRLKGIGIYFEKEKIDTLSIASEMMITVFAAFAQEESHSNSENMKRGIRQRFSMGKPKYTRTYGYGHSAKTGEWWIVEEEAKVVREIYDLYLGGRSLEEVANMLNNRGISHFGKPWIYSAIEYIISSEKYAGDCLMQKFYTVDFLSHKKVRNGKNAIDQYYKKGNQEAIVTYEEREAALMTLRLKNTKKGVSQYPFCGFLKCPVCGKKLVAVSLSEFDVKTPIAWVCGGSGGCLKIRDRSTCPRFAIRGENLENSVKKAFVEKGIVGNVSYWSLLKNVESITFPDWRHITIHWLDGTESTTELGFGLAREYPFPKFREIHSYPSRPKFDMDGTTVTGIRKERVENEFQRQAEIIGDATVEFEDGLPVVRMGVGSYPSKKVEQGTTGTTPHLN